MSRGMTAREILASCPRRVKDGATSAEVKKAVPSVSPDRRARLMATVHTTHFLGDGPKPSREIQKYRCTVECTEPETRLSKGNVKISCECPDYWATWEVALKKRGAADIHFSNGERPLIKNFAMTPGCCKHLYRLLHNVLTFKL